MQVSNCSIPPSDLDITSLIPTARASVSNSSEVYSVNRTIVSSGAIMIISRAASSPFMTGMARSRTIWAQVDDFFNGDPAIFSLAANFPARILLDASANRTSQ